MVLIPFSSERVKGDVTEVAAVLKARKEEPGVDRFGVVEGHALRPARVVPQDRSERYGELVAGRTRFGELAAHFLGEGDEIAARRPDRSRITAVAKADALLVADEAAMLANL